MLLLVYVGLVDSARNSDSEAKGCVLPPRLVRLA